MKADPTIDEIRRVRHEISCEVGHDLRRLLQTFHELEQQFASPSHDYGKLAASGAGAGQPTGARKTLPDAS